MAGCRVTGPRSARYWLLGVGVFALLWSADRWLGKEQRPRGALISLFFAACLSGRFLLEFWKEVPAQEVAWGLDTGQWLSILPALAGLAGCYLSWRWRVPAHWRPVAGVSARGLVDAPRK